MKSKLFFSEIYPGQEKNFQNDSFYDLSSFQYESLRQEIINYIYFRDRNMSIQEMERKKIMIEFFGEFCFSHKPMINALADYPYTELLHDFKNWCTETQISKLNYKYRRKGYKDLVDCNVVLENFKDIIRYSFKHDMRVEIEKARWDIRKLELPYQSEKIPKNFIVNFSKITQLQIHCAMKRAVLLWIRYLSLSTVQQRVWAMTKFSLYLFEFYPDVQTIYQLDRDIIEEYLIYRKTESKKQKNLTEELKGLKAAFEEFSKIYEDKQFTSLMLNTDIPSSPKISFQTYSIREQEAWMKAVPYMEKQVGRAFLLHTLLGTRISEILTLQKDCISKKKGIYWIRIDSTKGRTYSKPITKEIQSLVQASIEYTKKKYGVEDYVFVSKKNPEKPMAYTTMTYHLQKAIRELDLRDDKGRPFTPKTHIFRHCYGVKLTELHIPDETIAELLGHKNTDSVSYYRKISNKVMAKETRKSREKMDDILRDIINQWDGYEVVE